MLRRPSPRTLACLLACGLTWSLGAQAQKISDDVVRIGVLSDMSGLYVDTAGRGSVEAAKRALEDFGGQVLGKKVEIVWTATTPPAPCSRIVRGGPSQVNSA